MSSALTHTDWNLIISFIVLLVVVFLQQTRFCDIW